MFEIKYFFARYGYQAAAVFLLLVFILQVWRNRILNKVLDNLCKDNHDLIKGNSDIVWKRMRNDLGEAFQPSRWISVNDKRPDTDRVIVLCDDKLENPFILKPGENYIDDGINAAYWAPLPREKA